MDPMYRNIHSYPHHQREQLHCSPFPYPGTETIPPQTYAHHGQPPVWCSSSYGYVPPAAAGHGCCNHYPFVSPYAHHFPPVSYPSYPIQYMPPPPSCYPMEHPHTSTGGPHCCGCPNHLSQRVPQKNVRIEEEELADGGRRKNDSFSPLVWMPPDHGNNKDGKHKQEDDGKGGFPLPLFWLPYKPEEKEMEKHYSKDLNTKPSLDHVKEVGNKPEVSEDEGFKNDRGIKRDVPVKDGVDLGEKKVTGDSVNKNSPSPSKSSKLPPVCLRVDPLPRIKTANKSSQKEGSQSDEVKSKILNPSDNKKLDKISTNEVKEGKGTKNIEVVDGKTWQEKNKDVSVETHVNQPEEMAKAENTSQEYFGTSKELSGDKDVRKEEAKEIGKRIFSEEEAAVVIQKVYRGFETRRWDPVKKLKEIAKLREEMGNVKRMIQAMESSSDTEGSSKQSTFISESIMSLLLKVDTIQGLHPSIREVRKAVAKELVSLQEKLDSLTSKKSVNSPQQESSSRFPEDTSNKIDNVKLSENGSGITPLDSPKADQIQPDEALNCENLEISEASPNREKLMDKPEKEDEKSNEDLDEELENDEESRRSCEEALIHITREFQDDATDKENKEIHHELDLPLGEINVGLDEVDTKTRDDQSQPEECVDQQPQNSTTGIVKPSLLEQDMSGQLLHEGPTIGVENHEAFEENKKMHHVFDLPLSEIDVGSDEVDIQTRDHPSEPEECLDQQPQNSTTGIVEPSLTEQDMSVQVVHEAVEENTIGDEENNEMHHVLDPPLSEVNAGSNEVNIKTMHHVLDPPLSEVNAGSNEVNIKTGGDKSEPEACVDQNSTTDIVKSSLSEQDASGQLVDEGMTTTGVEDHEAVEENAKGDGKIIDVEDKKTDAVLACDEDEDGLMESNRKLVEENERLRIMMENLIRSGQEQVTAISRLTGRVKDLERRISSKKNKLKVRRGGCNKIMRAHNDE